MRILTPAVLLLVFLSAGCNRQQPAPVTAQPSPTGVDVDLKTQQDVGIIVEPAVVSTATSPITATGQLQLNEDRTWQVGAIIAGKIVNVPVQLGEIVRAGQIVAQMHSHEVYDARASRRQVVAELYRLQALEDQAKRIRDRTQRLLDLKAASREQMEAAETAYRSAQLSVANAKAEVEKASFHLQNFLEVPIGETGPPNSEQDRVPIKAPATGTVMERRANAGTVVSAGDPVVAISDLSTLWVIAAVNEEDLSQIHRGQSVQISVRAYPSRTFAGRVFQLGERMDPQTRTLQIRISVANPQSLLKPDMFATLSFAPSGARQAIYLPESAIQEIDGRNIVFVQSRTGNYEPREIKLGARVNRKVEIMSGVDPGALVVVSGALLLKSQLMKTGQD